jgi:hypothetical protein
VHTFPQAFILVRFAHIYHFVIFMLTSEKTFCANAIAINLVPFACQTKKLKRIFWMVLAEHNACAKTRRYLALPAAYSLATLEYVRNAIAVHVYTGHQDVSMPIVVQIYSSGSHWHRVHDRICDKTGTEG